jgi:hypothetical protein
LLLVLHRREVEVPGLPAVCARAYPCGGVVSLPPSPPANADESMELRLGILAG